MVYVKICGLTTLEDALFAAECGVDMLGFNFYAGSKRYIEPAKAASICDTLRRDSGANCPILIGLFVNESVGTISAITRKVGLDFAQLSGDESDSVLRELRGIAFKSIRAQNVTYAVEDAQYYISCAPQSEKAPSILLDAYVAGEYGGTGHEASDEIALAVKAVVPRLMLAGGLTPDNVTERVKTIQPWGVDVASGVEDAAPGVKSREKVKAFVEAVRQGVP